ncbi:MAG: DegQ family serine endoprotease [Rickettsiales bacterium]
MSTLRFFLSSLAIVIFITTSPAMVAKPAIAQEPPASFADLVDNLLPAVVNISTTQKIRTSGVFGDMPFPNFPNSPDMDPFRDFFERFGGPGLNTPKEREVYSLGSGFIIDASGYVITNNHVVEKAEEIKVILADQEKYTAKIIGRDPKTDLALLKIDAKKPLPFVTMGDSDTMRVGDWVIAIGNPFGLGGSVTKGIISARQRNINAGPFDDFLQTDAPINKGNSGGPLFNTKGEVIGINSAIFSPSMGGGSVGIGFAIPTSLAKPIVDQLKKFGRTHRGWLGVKIQKVSDEIADSLGMKKAIGALVLEVSEGSPAAKAGLKAGDVITHLDGKEIEEMRFLPRMVAETKSGSKVSLTYWRKNSSHNTSVTVGELDENEEKITSSKNNKNKNDNHDGQKLLGMEITPLNDHLRSQFRIKLKSGLIITHIDNNSEAEKTGLQEGDIIVSVNNNAVQKISDIKNMIDTAKKSGRKHILVKINRKGNEAFITLNINQ